MSIGKLERQAQNYQKELPWVKAKLHKGQKEGNFPTRTIVYLLTQADLKLPFHKDYQAVKPRERACAPCSLLQLIFCQDLPSAFKGTTKL